MDWGSLLKMEKKKRLEARLTEQELKLIEEKMKQCGIKNKRAYLRKMAIDGYLIQLDLSDVKEMIRLLRINSNNLNQYARKANECGSVYEKDIRDLQNQQKLLWVEMRKILEHLSKLQK